MPDNPVAACFIDSNIWLYAFVEGDDPSKLATARGLIRETEPVVSAQVINEVCVNMRKRANFTEEQIRRLIESFYSRCAIIELGESDLLIASQLRERYSLSFWDSTIVASALRAGVSILYTEDMQNGLSIEDQLEIRNPFVAK